VKWPESLTIIEARKRQNLLRERVRIAPLKREPRFVAGVDAAFSADRVFAAACLFLFPGLSPLEQETTAQKISFPYVPGFLSLREGPAILAALERLPHKPDLILVDGQGIAHPRGFGIASYIGVLTGIPAIGCAKSRLIGEYDEPGKKKGSWSPLEFDGEIVGAVLRTRDDTRPLFISPGHKTDLKTAIRFTLACTGNYRIPEPLRCADMLSKEMKKMNSGSNPKGQIKEGVL
jgi:deoxyribonuclease V